MTRRFREKMLAALECLAVREGDVRERLKGAHLQLMRLDRRDIPAEHRDEIASILSECTRYGPELFADGTPYRSALDHTMRRIRRATGRQIASRIFTIAIRVTGQN